MKNKLTLIVAIFALILTAMAPAQSHRQQTKNTWRNLAYAGGALGLLGLATHNGTLGWAGLAGGLYSAYRYEQDRKSQNKLTRQRALMFGHSTVWYHGHKYVRKTVWRHGTKYYTMVMVR